MGWQQIAIIILFTLSLGATLAKHGESSGKYNFWASLIGTGIYLALLISGGFFS